MQGDQGEDGPKVSRLMLGSIAAAFNLITISLVAPTLL